MMSHEGDLFMVADSDEVLLQRTCSEVLFNGKQGFGYGSGTISRSTQLQTGELTQEADENGSEYIQYNQNAFIPIDSEATDDGCGDGRVASKIYQVITDNDGRHVVEYKTSLNRAKVFGGGIVMTQAALMATGREKFKDTDELFAVATSVLRDKNIQFGAHTDTHAKGDNCGCGAIDKMPTILANITRYESQIQQTLQQLLGEDYNAEAFAAVITNFGTAFQQMSFDSYSGAKTMEKILESGAVVKQLNGDHQEDFVVLNFAEGTTFNQRDFFEYTENQSQAFCVDAWRLQKYADAVSADQAEQTKALYGMLIYTLATSATLTDGSQRIFANKA